MLFVSNRVYLWCGFASNPIVVLIGNMKTRRNAARRLEEEVANARTPPHDERVPPYKENINVEQEPDKPTRLTEAKMRAIHAQMSQAMTTQK